MSNSTSLPSVPSLEQLKRQAKDLTKLVKARDPEAARRIVSHLPRLAKATAQDVFASPLTLSEAQLVVAREYGFPSWPKLKHHLETLAPDFDAAFDAFKRAIRDGDSAKLKKLLQTTPALAAKINDPWDSFDSPAILSVANRRDRATLDVLLEFGADINARNDRWWAGGFGVLPCKDPKFADYLISRGARVDVWAAAGLNKLDELRALIEADPNLINARGGDGQTPLHFAASVEIAEYLLAHGAEIDIRDLDHIATPAQYMAADRPEVCRYLVSRGAEPDIFMAVQLSDMDLVRKVLAADPDSINARVGQGKFDSSEPNGGHIYFYTLENGHSPLYLAAELGHKDVTEVLLQHCTPVQRLLAACTAADEPAAVAVLAAHPGIVQSLGPAHMRIIADAAWRHKTDAVRIMLKIGFDIEAIGDEESTALNRAAVRGFGDLIALLLAHGASMDAKNKYGGTPFTACLWGAVNFRDPNGDYVASAEKLLAAGPPLNDLHYPNANKPVNAVLRRYLDRLSKDNIIAAIKLGNADRITALLDRDPSLVNKKTSGILPLYQAVRSNLPEIARLLLDCGANAALTQEEDGPTALEEAVKAERAEVIEILRGTA